MSDKPNGSEAERISDFKEKERKDNLDWNEVRQLSLNTGGFGDRRAELWPKLLNAKPSTSRIKLEDLEEPHSDERQIQLDTDRSFVLYPVDAPKGKDKDILQNELNTLLVSVFRKRPRLSYFQGYHDIITVLYLTLPEEMQLSCAEKLSLHRLRDAMGKTLEPLIGLLRVLRNLLRLADPEYAEIIEQTSPLPYPLLSPLLTLLAHDMPTLPLIQHTFDYLFSREPIAVVYLCAAVVMKRKSSVMQIVGEDDGDGLGMVHSLLSGLGDVCEEDEDNESERGDAMKGSETAERVEQTEESSRDPYNIPLPPEETDELASYEDSLDPTDFGTSAPLPPLPHPPSPSSDSSESPNPSIQRIRPPKIPLTDLLTLADSLMATHPPSHPSIYLSHIMGPQSVMYTWNSKLSDDEAEKMVDRPELVVYPEEESDEDERTNGKRSSRTGGIGRGKDIVERRKMIAGAMFALSIAIFVGYSMQHIHQREGMQRFWAQQGTWLGLFLTHL